MKTVTWERDVLALNGGDSGLNVCYLGMVRNTENLTSSHYVAKSTTQEVPMSTSEIYAECLVFPSSVMYCELATGVHIVDYCRKPIITYCCIIIEASPCLPTAGYS